jgi:hypothetical protein
MTLRLGLILTLWTLSSGAAFADTPTFALFQRLCVDTHANPAAALAAAKAEGFVEPLPAIIKDLATLQLEGSQSRAKLVDDGILILVVGHKPFPAGPGMTMAGCALVIAPADGPSEEALATWAGAGQTQGDDGQPFFLFTGDPAHRRSALDASGDELAAAAKNGDLQIAGASHKPDVTVLIYGPVQP